VEPDALRELLPETEGYIKRDPSTAGYLTQKEVGCFCEVSREKTVVRSEVGGGGVYDMA
jgi:hypothetical protein